MSFSRTLPVDVNAKPMRNSRRSTRARRCVAHRLSAVLTNDAVVVGIERFVNVRGELLDLLLLAAVDAAQETDRVRFGDLPVRTGSLTSSEGCEMFR